MNFRSTARRRWAISLVVFIALLTASISIGNRPVQAVSPNIVISQVYGGGGNSGATYTHDFIELFNRGTTSVSMAGWSLQYASATGTGNFGSSSTMITELPSISLAPGQYILIQEAQGAGGTTPLPTPDVTDASPIAMAAGAGKVALVNTITPLGCNGGSTACPPAALATIVDLVGYGNANFFEGSGPAPAPSNTTAVLRLNDGATDTDNNAADFVVGAPNPRNSSFGNEVAPTVTSTSPADGVVDAALSTNITITFSEPVNVAGSWFSISCSTSGAHTAVVSSGPTTFTLDPDSDFAFGESCTVTVLAGQVTDQDTNDPPDNMVADYPWSFTTLAADPCTLAATFVHEIQGSGLQSPLVGQVKTIQGVVVGDYQAAGQFNGFYVQEEDTDADADPATSEGIFVFHGGTSFPVDAGDLVRVTGTVVEFASSGVTLTELSGVSSVQVCSTGQSVTPTSVSLPVASLSDWESYEGMLVHIPHTLTVTENFTLGRFGEVSLSIGGRLLNPTSIVSPGAPAVAQQNLNDRSRILLDDGNNQQNIDPTFYPTGGLSASNTLRSGDTVDSLSGVLDQRFGLYRVQPVGPVAFDEDNLRPGAPAPVGGRLKVASFNVLNYFNGDGLGGGFPTSRGAETPFEFTRQRDKIISAITTMNADVIGLMEIENDAPPNSAVEDLVNGLNAVSGAGTYSYINTGIVGTDAIRVALIYKPASVSPVGSYAILDSSVDPLFDDTKNRPVLAQTFTENATGTVFTVAVNHLKSKGSDCNDVGDPDTGDGQGNCNLTRTRAATALVNWLATDPTGSGDADFLITGDLNSYAREDPITAIKNAGYTNLLESFLGNGAYSFVFQGQSGYLDHALSSPNLTPQVAGVTEWHINADEPIALDFNVNFKSANHVTTLYDPGPYRSSDHDPVIVGLNLTHNFTGFFPPVANPPTFNVVKAGSGVPVKFSLGGDKGLAIFASGFPKSNRIDCPVDETQDPVEETVNTSTSSLVYDPFTDQYVYLWKTNKSWGNTCRELVIQLNDGTTHRANFRFTR